MYKLTVIYKEFACDGGFLPISEEEVYNTLKEAIAAKKYWEDDLNVEEVVIEED